MAEPALFPSRRPVVQAERDRGEHAESAEVEQLDVEQTDVDQAQVERIEQVERVEQLPTDPLAALVAAAAEGDERAFTDLVAATYRDVFTLARRLTGDDEDARDVTQEAYLRVYRAVGSFRGEAQVSTWMYRITANCAATYLGRRSRHRHEELPATELVDPSSETDPAMRIDAHDTRNQLIEALDALPPKLRAVVVLRDVYELPHEVIGEELGISATAAKVRLHRARKRLRSALHPELDEVPSRAL